MNGNFELAWTTLQWLLIAGFSIGIIFAVTGGAIKLGWKYAPYVVAFAFIVWFFGG